MVRKVYKNWLNEANWDLETAKILREQKRYNSSAFYAQQSVEKLVKATLIFKNESPWGHSTRELLIRLLEVVDEDFSDLIHLSSELDLHYIPSRYPNAHPNSAPHEVYDNEIAENAIKNAQIIFNSLKSIFIINETADNEENGEKNEENNNKKEERVDKVLKMVKFQVFNSELKIFIEKAKQKMEIKIIILFGSRARGDHTQGSDFDLIFIGDFKDDFIKRPLKFLRLNESKYNYELFCYTEKEFEEMFRYGNALLLDALDEGVPLEGRAFFDTYKKKFNAMIEQGLKRSRCTWILPMT